MKCPDNLNISIVAFGFPILNTSLWFGETILSFFPYIPKIGIFISLILEDKSVLRKEAMLFKNEFNDVFVIPLIHYLRKIRVTTNSWCVKFHYGSKNMEIRKQE